MNEKDELKREIDDISEDHREEGESIYDLDKSGGNNKKAADDISEDHREEGESIEDLKRTIAQLTRERDEANQMFMASSAKGQDYDNLAEMFKKLLGGDKK